MSSFDYVEVKPTEETKKFSDLMPGEYKVTPLRLISTKYGSQLIIRCESTSGCEASTYYVPNSYRDLMLKVFPDTKITEDAPVFLHLHMMKYDGKEQKMSKGKPITIYHFAIAKLPKDELVQVERVAPKTNATW